MSYGPYVEEIYILVVNYLSFNEAYVNTIYNQPAHKINLAVIK